LGTLKFNLGVNLAINGGFVMAKMERDAEREERITMEIVVDAYGPQQQAMGWYYYLQDTMQFPFTATCITKRRISPVKEGETMVGIISMPIPLLSPQSVA
jgi:hypothetical protein